MKGAKSPLRVQSNRFSELLLEVLKTAQRGEKTFSTRCNIPDDWCAEFDTYDDVCPVIVIQVDQIRKAPAMMELKLRIIENPDDEYAGCMVRTEKKAIAFKVDCMSDLAKAIETMATE